MAVLVSKCVAGSPAKSNPPPLLVTRYNGVIVHTLSSDSLVGCISNGNSSLSDLDAGLGMSIQLTYNLC